ncbi:MULTISPECIES: orotidine-5'-phosphate decarboxylase [Listeria]|uniref:orotidine-5'-phosphate decarboxylase n=1 Tax=Listeria TaxID=1637 RepID=UPI000B589686|nr:MULTISPECIES: orotidine-5'-phosphate decarboxylase [Listeria]
MTKPIIALDFSTAEQVAGFLGKIAEEKLALKVGMELFYATGPAFVESLKAEGHEVFLDLKLHDIPNTVERAMAVIARLGVDMVNVHAAGGKRMMEAALSGLVKGSQGGKRPKLIAVTQLTSTSEADMQRDQQIQTTLLESVLNYSSLAYESGLDGVVCSAFEAHDIKKITHPDFLCVTPGIRLANAASDDQKRIVTPSAAREMQASAIVVGRPITQAENPQKAYAKIVEEWGK